MDFIAMGMPTIKIAMGYLDGLNPLIFFHLDWVNEDNFLDIFNTLSSFL